MNIIMISTDKKIFEPNSEVQNRMKRYALLFDALHIIVFTPIGFKKENPSANLWIYPTNSWNKWLHIVKAYYLGRKIRNIDVVSTQDPFECGIAGFLISRYLKAKLQLQIHTDFLSPYFAYESLINKVRMKIAKILIYRTNSIRVVSERIKASIMAFDERLVQKTLVLPIYIDTKEKEENRIDIRSQYASASHIFLMASRFTKEKNMLMGIYAMKDIVKIYPKAMLLIVGDGPERNRLVAEIKKLKLENNIRIESWTHNLDTYYAIADVFVITSNYEGYGRTAVEAARHHIPVVMTDVGIAIGSVVPIGDAKSLADCVIALLKDKKRKEFVLHGQKNFLESLPSREKYDEMFKNQFIINS